MNQMNEKKLLKENNIKEPLYLKLQFQYKYYFIEKINIFKKNMYKSKLKQ